MGQIYVDVAAAQAEMGIATLGTSGGGQEGGYWLYWNVDGYTGRGWFWDDPNNHDKEGWEAYIREGQLTCGTEHEATEQGLRDHISGGHADDLNDVLGGWDTGEKMVFVGSNYDQFQNYSCLADA